MSTKEKITDFISASANEKPVAAYNAFASVVEDKVQDLLTQKQDEIRLSMFESKITAKKFIGVVQKEAKKFFGSNLDSAEDAMGDIGDVEVSLKSPDKKKLADFVKHLKKKGYSRGYEYEMSGSDTVFVRHPDAAT